MYRNNPDYDHLMITSLFLFQSSRQKTNFPQKSAVQNKQSFYMKQKSS